MGARPRILFLEVLHVVHEGLALGESSAVLRRLALVLQVRLVKARRWELGDFLRDEVAHSLPAGVTLLLLAVLLDEACLLVKGWPWSLLGLVEVSPPGLHSELAPWIARSCEIGSRCSHVVIGSWSFLCFCQILPDSCADHNSALFEQL